ncbi:MAG: 1-deoxy-D-xylulose-5-phosphate synthase [Planctomycetes bacterium GWF2_41_51]|nr:MAG: 1-deoxy-D-xylulose-5-phosphate synthase [Planctomycetes bacterium GWF2_41_51]HBG27572.1 1-deoxy-D-xylulose-5-phosphate synthase [Phycisphaerales bacterium]
MQYELLDKINTPQDLRLLTVPQLNTLASEIREFITHSVSCTGGHLASNLGAVDLTIAMHYVFDFTKDKLIWDVGHQCYTHKILTGRRELFSKLRQKDGISGFPSPAESEYDQFSVGHAGTSIPTALGLALASEKLKTSEKIVAFVGDASIVNGSNFEALNNLGLIKRQLLVVLNDNSMAIDVSQGAIARFLAKVRLSHKYEDLRNTTNRILEHLPVVGKRVEGALESFKQTLRMAITPSRLFESLNIPYFGPVDGHDIGSLIELFKAMGHLSSPAVLHVYTKKGKGYTPAKEDPTKFHSTGPFKINGEIEIESTGKKSFTDVFSDSIVKLAKKDDRVIAITAAMPDGTGLVNFRNNFESRYYDVGIAESVAVDIAAGQAKMGLKPFVCIYSTFLQRGFDQIFQEVSLQNLPVVFCIDRAGLVGADGPTHHGLMDIGFLRMMPNMVLVSPANGIELEKALRFALDCSSPVAIRYPKEEVKDEFYRDVFSQPYELGKSVTVRNGSSNVVIVAYGSMIFEALKAANILEADNIDVTVINARFAKPLDDKIISLINADNIIVTVEDHYTACGFGAAVLEAAVKAGANTEKVKILGIEDIYVSVDKREKQLETMKIDAKSIVSTVKNLHSIDKFLQI